MRRRYRRTGATLENYAHEQQKAGRFNWAPNIRLRDLPAWLESQEVVPSDTKVSLLVAVGLLVVCLVNTSGLLLAKFLRRSGEIGVRRALGASRFAIYAQFLTEAGMIGLSGGVLGLAFTGFGVLGVGMVLPKGIAKLATLDMSLLFSNARTCGVFHPRRRPLSDLSRIPRAARQAPEVELRIEE